MLVFDHSNYCIVGNHYLLTTIITIRVYDTIIITGVVHRVYIDLSYTLYYMYTLNIRYNMADLMDNLNAVELSFIL